MSSSPTAPRATEVASPGSPATVRVTGSVLARPPTEGRYVTPVTLTSLPRRPTIGSPTASARSSSTKLYTSTFGSTVAPSSATSSGPPSTIKLPAPYSVARQPASPAATSRLLSHHPHLSPGGRDGVDKSSPSSPRSSSPLTLTLTLVDPSVKVTSQVPHVSGESHASMPRPTAANADSENADNNHFNDDGGQGHALSRKRDAHTIHLGHSGGHPGSPLRSPTSLSRSHTLPVGYNAHIAGVTDTNNTSNQSPNAVHIPPSPAFFAEPLPASTASATSTATTLPEFKDVLSTGSSNPATRTTNQEIQATTELPAEAAARRSPETRSRVQFHEVTFDLNVEAPVDDITVLSSIPDGTDGSIQSKNSANGRQQLGAGPLPTNPTSPLPKNRFSLSSTDSESKSASFRSSPQTLTPASVSIDESSEGESCHTFGVPLALCPPSSKSRFIPLVVELCVRVIEERGITNQGIYRVPGNKGAVHALELELNKNIDAIDVTSDQWQDVNAITSLLKMFFRKLPEPLITEELYEPMITANRVENAEKRMLKMKKILHEMPEHNFETFRFLAQHLDRVTRHGDKNKMDAHNLSIIFGPTLIRTKADNMAAMVNDMNDQCRIIETIILHFKWFFSSWDEDVNVPEDKEAENVTMSIGAFNEQLARIEGKDKDISAKDVVSSIFSAANKRIRSRKDRARGPDLDPMASDCSLTSRLRGQGHHGDLVDPHKSLTFAKDSKEDSGYVKFEYVQRREDKAMTPARDT